MPVGQQRPDDPKEIRTLKVLFAICVFLMGIAFLLVALVGAVRIMNGEPINPDVPYLAGIFGVMLCIGGYSAASGGSHSN